MDKITIAMKMTNPIIINLLCNLWSRNSSGCDISDSYPFGSIPRRNSSLRPSSLSQLARLTPSLLASLSNCSFNSGTIRIWNGGAFPVPFCFLSRLITVDMCTPIALCFGSLGVHLNTCTSKNATPRSGGTQAGRLTTNDRKRIEVAM